MRDPEILPQQAREHPEPHEQTRPVPWSVAVLAAAALAFGVVYIINSPQVNAPSTWGDGRTRAELAGGEPSSAKADGAGLYASLCAACHQASGQGLPGVFPPLAGSEWVVGKEGTLVAIVLHGVNGPMTVKGVRYTGSMPAFQSQLDDAQIAALLSYLRSQWGNSGAAVQASTVAAVRQATSARTGPFAGGDELQALP